MFTDIELGLFAFAVFFSVGVVVAAFLDSKEFM